MIPLDIPLDNPHRRNIHLPPLDHIKSRSPQEHSPKHGNVPIHRLWLHWRRRREEAKHEERQQKHQSDDVDGHAGTAKGPARRRQRLAAQTLGEDAAYGEDVGAEKCGEGEGDDGIEGDGGPEVDETDDDAEEEGNDYCV